MNCGRGPGGNWVDELGLCPAASAVECEGLNGGTNGGRICWAIAGTMCGGNPQGTFADKCTSCITCEVFLSVEEEEGGSFQLRTPEVTKRKVAEPPKGTHQRIIEDVPKD